MDIFDDSEIDIASMLQKARREMDDSTWRHTFRKIDFMNFSPKQKSALNSQASALYLKTNNQFGKTTAATGIVVFQTTQEFPPWFTGWRQPKLNLVRPHSMVVWCLAPNWQMARDGIASKILGDYASGQIGQGLMPAENIVSVQAARGIAGAIDSVVIRRKDATTAVIRFKTYEQGREALQSESVDLIIADEMPTDMGLWNELLARLSATSGIIWLTATPRRQQSPIAQWYKEPGHPERQTITATIDDTTHLSETQRSEMKARFANNPAEAATRLYGQDYAGGGNIFTIPPEAITFECGPERLQAFGSSRYHHILGLDPNHGGASPSAHPTGAVQCAYDHYSDTFYVLDAIRFPGGTALDTIVARIRDWELGDARVAWGAAENQTAFGTSESIAQIYKRKGLNMLHNHATVDGNPGGGVALEPALTLMQEAFAARKLQVASHLHEWLDEYCSYERDEKNAVIKVRDDLLDATRYAFLMRKHARHCDGEKRPFGNYNNDRNRERNTGVGGGMCLGLDFDIFTGR